MGKETRKQIVEQTRNEVAKLYKARIAEFEERLKRANECSYQFMRAYNEEKERADELQEKLSQYEDWIERLQSFMDLPSDEREKAFAEIKAKRKINEKLDGLISNYSSYMSLFGI